jgi:hypothetical protein
MLGEEALQNNACGKLEFIHEAMEKKEGRREWKKEALTIQGTQNWPVQHIGNCDIAVPNSVRGAARTHRLATEDNLLFTEVVFYQNVQG